MNDKNSYAKIIGKLGFEDKDQLEYINELAKNPRVSVGLLIDSLHIIPDTFTVVEWSGQPTEHRAWIIRALKYLTGGLEFCSPTKYVFDTTDLEKDREQFLGLKYGDCLTFMGYWMSHDRTYIAPVDVQESIIAQWKDWYVKYGENYEYKPLQNPTFDDWMY